jgi:hypothetical protein
MTARILRYIRLLATAALTLGIILFIVTGALGQENNAPKSKEVYNQLKAFSLTGGSAKAEALVLKRDRAEMTFDGTFYFGPPVDGRVTAAVFIGQGKFRAEVPPSGFEKENVRRLLGEEVVESDFKTAVFRFTDDTFDIIGRDRREGGGNEQAQKLATETEPRILKQTGANITARLALSILNAEKPGFFFAAFDGGKRDRFSFVLDYQNRIPVANFDLNGGEKGMIFSYASALIGNDIWMTFYGLEDYQHRTVNYSDVNNLVDITNYQLDVDLREHKSRLRLANKLSMEVRAPNLRAIPFQIGESLGELDNRRLKKQLRVKTVRAGGEELVFAQEDWEGGFTVFLAKPAQTDQKLDLDVDLEGDFMYDAETVSDCYYPLSNTSWYPRHGYLDRSTFDLSFRHPKRLRIASVGSRTAEAPDPDDKNVVITRYKMQQPVALVTFALGPFERHTQMVKWDKGGEPIPVEFSSLGSQKPIKEDFIVAELDNSLRYFSVMFGKYPYPIFGAAFHPFSFGQGFPSLLMIPATDRATKYTFSFIAHETAHQWWGDIVSWRSYRDQWLSKGFAEYSGVLYTALRDGRKSADELLRDLRTSLKDPPQTTSGLGKGRLADVGPIILGHRLATSKTLDAYEALIYNKGALVLRMLHFLMTNPPDRNDRAFFAMMTDFVERHRDKFASTTDFLAVASQHFARTPIAQKYQLTDLNWFFNQWVFQAGLPSYQLEYQIQDQPDGTAIVSGTVTQENVPETWFMPLPLVMTFAGNQEARGTIHAQGPKTPFQIKLPMKPRKVELDPHNWILSEKTSTRAK